MSGLPTDAKKRKAIPLATGCVDYFPDALAEVAELSRIGNEQHNPGKPLHWDRSKSTDEADCLMRHFVQRGTRDSDRVRHSTKVAWRALALLQKEIEADRPKEREVNKLPEDWGPVYPGSGLTAGSPETIQDAHLSRSGGGLHPGREADCLFCTKGY